MKMKMKTDLSQARLRKLQHRAKRSKLKKKLLNTRQHGDWRSVIKAENALRKSHSNILICKRKLGQLCSKQRMPICVPKLIDFYNVHNFEKMNSFLDTLRKCIQEEGRVFLDFSMTEYASASAMLSFLAEVDILTTHSPYGKRAIAFNHPSNGKIESILKQVGFYDLLGKRDRVTNDYADVVFWKYASGACSEPILAKGIFAEIKQEIQIKGSKKLYRGFVEAMSNSVEHAYAANEALATSDGPAKWWAFSGIKDDKLLFVICDKGVGIPNTLPATQKGNLDAIFNILGLTGRKDSAFIKAASNLNRTSTKLPNRGKGLTDIKSVIDTNDGALLSIFSNRGRYIYKGLNRGLVKDIVLDYKHSVGGTIVEWVIPLPKEGTVYE